MKTKKGLHEEESTFASEHYYNSHLQIRHLESQSDFKVTMVTILVVDRKTSSVTEKIDDSKEDFIEAVLLSTHSTGKPTVVSYVSIFENFWNQVELYQNLKQHDKIQKEFINIAAHELRTPAQSILGYAELAMADTHYTEKQIQSFMEVVYRNAFRMQKLTMTS
jgi:signal transduction histidine kinase